MRFAEVEGRAVLYWLDGPLIYALVGDGGEEELRDDGPQRLCRDRDRRPAGSRRRATCSRRPARSAPKRAPRSRGTNSLPSRLPACRDRLGPQAAGPRRRAFVDNDRENRDAWHRRSLFGASLAAALLLAACGSNTEERAATGGLSRRGGGRAWSAARWVPWSAARSAPAPAPRSTRASTKRRRRTAE